MRGSRELRHSPCSPPPPGAVCVSVSECVCLSRVAAKTPELGSLMERKRFPSCPQLTVSCGTGAKGCPYVVSAVHRVAEVAAQGWERAWAFA